ncbi:hypothetical protein NC653_041726 [Populus alba x Populus x berolinensis]|uniref:Uncharacterized protein n=1 Tax=Populus alba x Populus x berolinensis TaxID=444605 RepID=A0AAD6PPJ3_9ROSI|nr:hypothetical protein NC653_041726 [Populus alba x Populus x berolinensis]
MEGDTCEEGKAKGPLPVLTNYTRTHPSMGSMEPHVQICGVGPVGKCFRRCLFTR